MSDPSEGAHPYASPLRAPDLSGLPPALLLKPDAWPVWLGEEPADEPQLKALLAPYPADDMVCWPVSARVGNVRNNDSSLIDPLSRRKRPVCPGKFINLDDHCVMLLEISWTIEFFPPRSSPRKPRPPPPGFSFRKVALCRRQAPP